MDEPHPPQPSAEDAVAVLDARAPVELREPTDEELELQGGCRGDAPRGTGGWVGASALTAEDVEIELEEVELDELLLREITIDGMCGVY